jgi:hypothetical protein
LQRSRTGLRKRYRQGRQTFGARIFNKRQEAVAVFSIEPDSLSRRRCRPRRERGLFCGHRVPNGSTAFAQKAELVLFMLPGFRFLFAAIVLSMSILIFGLGAAALLRAAHEQFVSNPSWHATPEAVFAQQSEATMPVLAMLHVDPPAVEREKAPDDVPPAAAPMEQATSVAQPLETSPIVAVPAEPEQTAALTPEQAAPAEVAKPEVPDTQSSASSEGMAAKADMPVLPDTPAPEPKIAATEQSLPTPANETAPVATEATPVEATPAPPDPTSAPASMAAEIAATKIATLGGPPVAIEAQPPAKAADAKPDGSAVNKRVQARRAAQRRKIAARARLARQVAQQPASPFPQPFAPTPARTP